MPGSIHQFHEALDKGRFAGSDRTYDAYVDFPVRSGLNVTVYVKIVHKNTPLAMLIQVYAGEGAYAKNIGEEVCPYLSFSDNYF